MKFIIVIALSLVAAVAAANPPTHTKVEPVNPFTRVAYVPFGTNLSTVKFDNVKAVKADTEKISTWDDVFCRATSDGQAALCPAVSYDKPAPAYHVTYYFQTTPDDTGDIYSSIEFSLAPSELTPAMTAKLASLNTLSKTERAKLFILTFDQSPVQEDVIDEANSNFCDGYYVDSGLFIKYDNKCQDQVVYKTITTSPDAVTVTLTPAL